MKIIVVGCGNTGYKIVEHLSSENEHDITVVDIKNEIVQDIVNRFDIMGVVGSGPRMDILLEAGIEQADLLIAVADSDELNLLTCFIAKKLGDCQTIARVRNPEYSKQIHIFKEDLGLALIINPEQTAATEMARLLRFPTAIQIDTFAKGRVEVLKFRVACDSVLCNMKIADMRARLNCDVLVCGAERKEATFIPSGNFVIEEGDLLSVVGSPSNVSEFFKKIGIKTNRVKDTLIVGGGETAYYLAKILMRDGISVKIIEEKADRCDELSELLPKATILHGDGTDNEILLEEGIEYCESFVSLTESDEENVLLSLFAMSKTKGKTITRINRTAYESVISKLDLDAVINPEIITAEYIVRFVRAMNNSYGSNIETMHLILDGKAEALEFHIKDNSPVEGKTIESLSLNPNVLIACIARPGEIITPGGKDVIMKGDSVIVVTTNKGYNDISDILR